MNSVSLKDADSKINSAFTKANYELLENHQDKFVGKTLEEKKQLLKDLWLADYKANITSTELVFDRKKDLTMFLLRWS
jgi:hypothetical protein